MEFIVTVENNNQQALEVIEYLKMFDFVRIVKDIKVKSEATVAPLEEDEDGIPLKYKEDILAMSKSVNKKIAQRWREERSTRYGL
ncbi:glutaredoxin-2 domain protein [Capnocytophaga granulosa]|jgi:hypothetical protein|uniref:glutaredoxin-2 domain protein n=1 Tax=Capnocytophaga granulosa TaxID=45242 RepID=UPI0023F27C38|nr:glutaredoxin-2 domain protein [Capnocytophaga granulosa]